MAPPVAHEPARPAHNRDQWKVASRGLLRFQYHFAHLPHAKLRDPGHHNTRPSWNEVASFGVRVHVGNGLRI